MLQIVEPRKVAAVLPRKAGRDGGWVAQHTCVDGDHELTLSLPRVADRLAEEFGRCEAEFALVVEDPIAILCYRFGDLIGWGWVPCTPAAARPASGSPVQVRALLHAALRDDRGLRAGRNVTLSLDFTRCLDEALAEQARVPFDPVARSRALSVLNRRAPTPSALVARAVARCVGSP